MLIPRDECVGGQIGHQVHIALNDAGKALDRRAIEPDPMTKGIFQLTGREGHGFSHTQNIGKLEIDKGDALRLNLLQ